MNAERLHAIALAVRDDLQQTQTVKRLQELRDALQQQVNQPQQPGPQQQVSKIRQELTAALENAPSNSFTPAWRQILDEIGASSFLGSTLSGTLDGVFARNQITPSVAQEEVQQLHKGAEQLSAAIQQLIKSFAQLGIGSEQLQPGECELGVLVPRGAVENRLDEFGAELGQLNKTFGTFAELAIGSRPGFEIRTVSSTDFAVFLALAPEIGACIAIAVERIVSLYKQLLEIRLLRSQLAEQGVTDKSLQGIDSHANMHMEKGIDALIGELIDRYAGNIDEGRRNELRTELKHSLNRIANRVDLGYNIDVRAEPLPEPEEPDADETDDDLRAAIETISEASATLQFLKPAGSPILSLPEPELNDDEE